MAANGNLLGLLCCCWWRDMQAKHILLVVRRDCHASMPNKADYWRDVLCCALKTLTMCSHTDRSTKGHMAPTHAAYLKTKAWGAG